jgi:hypothetical protein
MKGGGHGQLRDIGITRYEIEFVLRRPADFSRRRADGASVKAGAGSRWSDC